MKIKYAVDRVENNIILLENLDTKEIKNIDKNIINFNISDGDILIYENNKYYLDTKYKNERIKIIMEKLTKVKKDS